MQVTDDGDERAQRVGNFQDRQGPSGVGKQFTAPGGQGRRHDDRNRLAFAERPQVAFVFEEGDATGPGLSEWSGCLDAPSSHWRSPRIRCGSRRRFAVPICSRAE